MTQPTQKSTAGTRSFGCFNVPAHLAQYYPRMKHLFIRATHTALEIWGEFSTLSSGTIGTDFLQNVPPCLRPPSWYLICLDSYSTFYGYGPFHRFGSQAFFLVKKQWWYPLQMSFITSKTWNSISTHFLYFSISRAERTTIFPLQVSIRFEFYKNWSYNI